MALASEHCKLTSLDLGGNVLGANARDAIWQSLASVEWCSDETSDDY